MDLIKLSPYEFSWYNIWLQKSQAMPIHSCEPLFKYYHMAYQQFGDVITNVDDKTLARSYIGVTICSYRRDQRVLAVSDIDEVYYDVKNDVIAKIFRVIMKNYIRSIKSKLRKIRAILRR